LESKLVPPAKTHSNISRSFLLVCKFAGDESKVGLLKGLAGAENTLLLYQADLYNAEEFEPAIRGCQFEFLVATPMAHYANSTKVGGVLSEYLQPIHLFFI